MESNTEKNMSKADELEFRRYFTKALAWASGVAVSIVISIGGFLYKKMDDRMTTIEKENREIMVDYSSRIVRLETATQDIQVWQKDMQEAVKEAMKESRNNQQEILNAVRGLDIPRKD